MSTRDKLKEYAASHAVTLDVAIDRLLAEHAEREFWAAMAAISPDQYEAEMKAEGQWPGDYDYRLEDDMALSQPPAQPALASDTQEH